MKWVVVAIVVFIAGYTYVNIRYRKPGPEYEPYADMKRRANTLRLLAAGYQCVRVPVERPADIRGVRNAAFPAPGGLPADLSRTIVSRPLLPTEILSAHAPSTVGHGAPYVIEFRCVVPDHRQQLAGAELYVKGDRLLITPDFEILAAGLETRTRDTYVELTIPADTVKPGDYRVTLVGQRASRAWRVEVK